MEVNEGKADTTAINPSGENPSGQIAAPSAATLEAGKSAFEQHVAENAKRGRGRPIIHGAYSKLGKSPAGKSPARPFPVGKMATGPSELLLEETQSPAVPIGTEDIKPAFDEQINRQYAGLVVNCLVAVSNTIKRRRIIKETDNPSLADFIEEKRKPIGQTPRESIEIGLVECARKYGLDLSHTPEGMVILGVLVWQTEEAANTKVLIAEYFKIRPTEQKANP